MADIFDAPGGNPFATATPLVGSTYTAPNSSDLRSRIKLLTADQPWLAEQSEVALALARQQTSDQDMLDAARNAFHGEFANSFANNFNQFDDAHKRSIWSGLSRQQRRALIDSGAAVPDMEEDDDSLAHRWLSGAAHVAGSVAGTAMHAGGTVIGKTLVPALHTLQVVGDTAQHAYRTGYELVTTDPNDSVEQAKRQGGWMGYAPNSNLEKVTFADRVRDAWFKTGVGERVFTFEAKDKAYKILGEDDVLTAVAQDVALNTPDEVAMDLAGYDGGPYGENRQKAIDHLARRVGAPGTRAYQSAYMEIDQTLDDPKMQQAIAALKEGHVSIGRGIERLFGVDGGPGRGILSGSIDASVAWFLDPTLLAGKALKASRIVREGIALERLGFSGALVERVSELTERPSVQRFAEEMAQHLNAGQAAELGRKFPAQEALFSSFRDYAKGAGLAREVQVGERAQLEYNVTRDDILDFYKDGAGITALVLGRGNTAAHGIITLPKVSAVGLRRKALTGELRTVLDFASGGAADLGAYKAGELAGAEKLGAAIGNVPVLNRLTVPLTGFAKAVITQAPQYRDVLIDGVQSQSGRVSDKEMRLVGEAFGTMFGLSRRAKEEFVNGILLSPTAAGRRAGLKSLLTAGAENAGFFADDATQEMAKFADEILGIKGKIYSAAGEDIKRVGTHEIHEGIWPEADTAEAIGVPSFREMAKQTHRMNVHRTLWGFVNPSFVDSAMSRYWKPSVLLRLGFIPRAAGDEVLSFALRDWSGLARGYALKYAASPEKEWLAQDKIARFAGTLTAWAGGDAAAKDPVAAYVYSQIQRANKFSRDAVAKVALHGLDRQYAYEALHDPRIQASFAEVSASEHGIHEVRRPGNVLDLETRGPDRSVKIVPITVAPGNITKEYGAEDLGFWHWMREQRAKIIRTPMGRARAEEMARFMSPEAARHISEAFGGADPVDVIQTLAHDMTLGFVEKIFDGVHTGNAAFLDELTRIPTKGVGYSETRDDFIQRFRELEERVSRAEKKGGITEFTPEMKDALNTGDWKTFSKLRGYTPEEMADFELHLKTLELHPEARNGFASSEFQTLPYPAGSPNAGDEFMSLTDDEIGRIYDLPRRRGGRVGRGEELSARDVRHLNEAAAGDENHFVRAVVQPITRGHALVDEATGEATDVLRQYGQELEDAIVGERDYYAERLAHLEGPASAQAQTAYDNLGEYLKVLKKARRSAVRTTPGTMLEELQRPTLPDNTIEGLRRIAGIKDPNTRSFVLGRLREAAFHSENEVQVYRTMEEAVAAQMEAARKVAHAPESQSAWEHFDWSVRGGDKPVLSERAARGIIDDEVRAGAPPVSDEDFEAVYEELAAKRGMITERASKEEMATRQDADFGFLFSSKDGEDVLHRMLVPLLADNPERTYSSIHDAIDVGERVNLRIQGPMVQVVNEATWDKAVRWGFDNVIGRSIDSIIRQPLWLNNVVKGMRDGAALRDFLFETQFAGSIKELPLGAQEISDFLHKVEAPVTEGGLGLQFGKRWLRSPAELQAVRTELGAKLGREVTAGEMRELRSLARMQHNLDQIHMDVAIERGIVDSVPFIDDHHIRSQFQEWANNFVPFWFAEEQFLKRWARTLRYAPEAFQRAQLTYMGLRHAGVVRKNEYGEDVFVYPGNGVMSAMLAKPIKWVTGADMTLPIANALTGEVKYSLPGLDNAGVPSFSPLVVIPTAFVGNMYPELDPLVTAVEGGRVKPGNPLKQLVPTALQRFIVASNPEDYLSAQYAAMSYMAANNMQPPDDATPGEIDEYKDRLREWTRITLLTRAIFGFVGPASPGIDLPQTTPTSNKRHGGRYLRNEFLEMLGQYPDYQSAYGAFMARYPDATAYTVFRSQSVSGAPLPATNAALKSMEENRGFYKSFKYAGPWMLPQKGDDEPYNRKAYYQQTANEFRKKFSVDEYYAQLKFAEAADVYFDTVEDMKGMMEGAAPHERADMQAWLQGWKASYFEQHPTFYQQLVGSQREAERTQVIDEMRLALRDPRRPDSKHVGSLETMIRAFDTTMRARAQLGSSRSAAIERAKDYESAQFETWGERFVLKHPELRTFWRSIIAPQAGIDNAFGEA